MSFSKKLIFILLFAVTTQSIVFTYDRTKYDEQRENIRYFMNILYQQNSPKANAAGKWLNDRLDNGSEDEIVSIAKIIDDPSLTMESQINIFLSNQKQFSRITMMAIGGAIATGLIGILYLTGGLVGPILFPDITNDFKAPDMFH